MVELSILLSAYNAEKFIKEAIQSILDQTFQNFELLIADDGSTDDTKNIIDTYLSGHEKVLIKHNSRNLGKNATIEQLLSMASGKYISIHDADDFSHPRRFEKQIAWLENNKEFRLVGCDFYEIDHSGEVVNLCAMPSDYQRIKNDIWKSSQFHGPTMVFDHEVINAVGGLYRYFTWGEDIDFSMRVVEKFKATNINEPLYYYRLNENSLTKEIDSFTKARLVNKQLRLFLANERKANGADSLMNNRMDLVENEKLRLIGQIKNHEPLTQAISYYLGLNMTSMALKASFRLLKLNPIRLKSWRLFGYIVKVSLSSLLAPRKS